MHMHSDSFTHAHTHTHTHTQTQVCTDLADLKDLKVILQKVTEAC